MSKPILFIDFYKTLNYDMFWRSLAADKSQEVQEILFKNERALADDWMRGKHTAEQINQIVAEKINIPYEQLWNIFVNDCKNMTVPIGTLETINSLRQKYLTILITDNMDNFTRFTLPALKLGDYFDHVVNSYDEKMLKADNGGELFLKHSTLHDANIRECLCLDDSNTVYQTFTQLGGKAYLVTPEQDVSYYLGKLSLPT